jgi:hypothetical protein
MQVHSMTVPELSAYLPDQPQRLAQVIRRLFTPTTVTDPAIVAFAAVLNADMLRALRSTSQPLSVYPGRARVRRDFCSKPSEDKPDRGCNRGRITPLFVLPSFNAFTALHRYSSLANEDHHQLVIRLLSASLHIATRVSQQPHDSSTKCHVSGVLTFAYHFQF